MTRKHLLWAGLSTAILSMACGCSQELKDPDSDVPHAGLLNHSVSAVIAPPEDGATKVIIDSDGAFKWSEWDIIAVWNTSGTVYPMSLSAGSGTASATFSGETSGTLEGYAVYPYEDRNDSYHSSGTGVHVQLPSTYDIDTSISDWKTFYATYSLLPMVASYASSMTFYHVGAILRITLANVPSGTKHLVVTTDQDITGDFTVSNPGTSTSRISTSSLTSNNTVTYTLSSALSSATSGIVLNVPVPTGTFGALSVEAQNASSERLSLATFDNTRTLDRAHGRKINLDMTATDTRLVALSVSDATVSPGAAQATALTISATALSGSAATDYSLGASSSDTSVASVDVSGTTVTVTGKKNGTATITVTATKGTDTITETATVTVRSLGSATITASSENVQISKSVTLTCGLTDETSASITADSYEWSITSGNGLATLSGSGSEVTLNAGSTAGSVTVQCTATAGTLTATDTKTITIRVRPDGYAGPFILSDGTYFLSNGDMYKTSSGYALYTDPFAGLGEYGMGTPNNTTEGNVYFQWPHLATLFDGNVTNSDTAGPSTAFDIDNEKTPITDNYLPTADQWDELAGTDRAGSTVNGSSAYFHFVKVIINGVVGLSDDEGYSLVNDGDPTERSGYQSGLILFPDGAAIVTTYVFNENDLDDGAKDWKCFYPSTDDIYYMTNAQLEELLEQGCAFLPAAGDYWNNNSSDPMWSGGGELIEYSSATTFTSDLCVYFSASTSDIGLQSSTYKNTHWLPVRLLLKSE